MQTLEIPANLYNIECDVSVQNVYRLNLVWNVFLACYVLHILSPKVSLNHTLFPFSPIALSNTEFIVANHIETNKEISPENLGDVWEINTYTVEEKEELGL